MEDGVEGWEVWVEGEGMMRWLGEIAKRERGRGALDGV